METALENTILDVLKQLCSGRGKQREVAEKFGISRQYLNKLLNGVAPISSISLETLQKMFPRVTFNLNGDGKHVGTFAAVDERRILELEKKNLELDKENLELKKRIFELEKQLASPSVAVSPTVSKFTLKPSEQK